MREIEPKVPIDALDPARREPGYWVRFHRSVMKAAGPELARRASAGVPSLEDLLASWSRLFAPGAVAVAALAGLLLVADTDRVLPLPMAGVEELLTPEWAEGDPEPLPAFFFQEEDFDAVLLAANPF
jgi:hypothetical protein